MSRMDISVIGLGKVGLSLASCLVGAGHKVIGVDLDAAVVEAVNQRTVQTQEPGVVERLCKAPHGFLVATTDPVQAVRETQITFVIVPTPSNTLGGFSLRYVLHACDDIGAGVRAKSGPHTVAIVSTMLPGSSDLVVMPRLEQAAGRKIGDSLFYCYNPSFIALGEVVKGFEQPDYLLVGEADAAAGDIVLAVHQSIVKAEAPIARMTPVEAEIAKVASNTHETMRVSFANMLLTVCSEVPGANVDRITDALAHRMGRRFFKGAVPYGGPCWPRDNQAFSSFIDVIGAVSTLPRAVDTFNHEHARFVLRKILALSSPGDTVALLGLAYKPGTPVIERSFALDLASWLVRERRRVIGWDPLAIDEARAVLGDRIAFEPSLGNCLRQSTVAVITIPLRELNHANWSAGRHLRMVDCWRCLSAAAASSFAEYVPLGRGPANDVGRWLENTAGDRFRLLTS
jgi:UDPglucose 6-dehydrogenase